ncbi:MAG: helix-turn-helix transcriptional regulator [Gemmatimonadetes bacterium]|jgi:NarL family two-component system response regulator LiaR|nr:helix-turn-helix transcriptional regulator [Gemmatimonadota bacterium]MBP7549504.1 helix-turn-helix transcriptional regulator [Gemmatimonadaceae bacterium]
MRRPILLYGLLCGLLIALLQFIEYRWLVVDRRVEIYGALIAALFAGVGIWLGLRITGRAERVVVREVPVPVEVHVEVPAPVDFVRDEAQVASLGLTPRELEILAFIAAGLSNREIAERAFVSENTVKTHVSRVFEKLGAGRRTQAVQRGKSLRLIP